MYNPTPQYRPPARRSSFSLGHDTAAAGRRALAWSVDFGLVLVLAGLLATIVVQKISSSLPSTTALAGMGTWQVLTSQGDIPQAAGNVGMSLWRSAVQTVEVAFATLVASQFAYQFVSVSWRGRTIGKAACGIQVRAESSRPGRAQAARRAVVTTVAETGLYALACCLLLEGLFALSVLCWLLAVAAFWGNLLPAIGRDRRTVADRLAGTHVARAGLLRDAAQAALQGAAQGGRLAAEGARNVLNSAPVQQALASERAQRLGTAGQRTAARGRDALGKARRTRRERRAARPSDLPGTARPAPGLPPPPPYGVQYGPHHAARPPYPPPADPRAGNHEHGDGRTPPAPPR